MKVSNIYVVNVILKHHEEEAYIPISNPNMKVLSIPVVNVTIELLREATYQDISNQSINKIVFFKCDYCVFLYILP